MCGKAKRDSSVLVLLAPTGQHDCVIRQLVPSEDFQIPVEKTEALTVQSQIQQLHKKWAMVP